MKRFFNSQFFFWLFCFAVAFTIIMGAASCATSKHQPESYQGIHQQQRKFQQQQKANRHEQYRIQQRYLNR